jgi:phytoene dehydrogenase-like protein
MYDTIIIGAGMSGLAAGIRLAHFQDRVAILERHTTVGGLNSYYRRRGRDYEVGLHAVTNYAAKGTRHGPLARLLRQLRMSWDELAPTPQIGSRIAFPGVTLEFDNDFQRFREEVHRQFPAEKDGFERLAGELAEYDQLGSAETLGSAREVVSRYVHDPLLVEMILCPLLFYGGPRERDMDFGLFSVLFRSVYLEGLARPAGGIRAVLDGLVRKFQELGGELRLRAGVRQIVVRDGVAETVVLDDGSELSARRVISSAGWRETLRLCESPGTPQDALPPPGQISFVESISWLAAAPQTLGLDRTAVFFNDSPRFDYARPDELVDLRSGVVCSPNNFRSEQPPMEGSVRITMLANFDRWAGLDTAAYRLAKRQAYDKMVDSATRFVPDFRGSVTATDVFTPKTIRRFTGKDQGAVYGAPEKRYDGTTPVGNVFLCGTDQGLVGIVGAITSGIAVANRHVLLAGRD